MNSRKPALRSGFFIVRSPADQFPLRPFELAYKRAEAASIFPDFNEETLPIGVPRAVCETAPDRIEKRSKLFPKARDVVRCGMGRRDSFGSGTEIAFPRRSPFRSRTVRQKSDGCVCPSDADVIAVDHEQRQREKVEFRVEKSAYGRPSERKDPVALILPSSAVLPHVCVERFGFLGAEAEADPVAFSRNHRREDPAAHTEPEPLFDVRRKRSGRRFIRENGYPAGFRLQ